MTGYGPSRLHQLHLNGPDVTPVGDCYRTALACVLGLADPTMVPHFVDIELQHRSLAQPSISSLWAREWLRGKTGDADLAVIPPDALHDLAVAEDMRIFGVATVPGHRATWHCVVWEALSNTCWHDPTPAEFRGRWYTVDDVDAVEVVVARYEPGPYEPASEITIYPLFEPWSVL